MRLFTLFEMRRGIFAPIRKLARGSQQYKILTKEKSRWDLASLEHKRMHGSREDRDVVCFCEEFLKNILAHPERIYFSRHLQKRLRGYVDKKSRCGTYYELYEGECQFITYYMNTFKDLEPKLVEIGFNHNSQVCKIAATAKLPTQRTLFLCFGVDAGLKTIYVTPEYKYRSKYKPKDSSIRYE